MKDLEQKIREINEQLETADMKDLDKLIKAKNEAIELLKVMQFRKKREQDKRAEAEAILMEKERIELINHSCKAHDQAQAILEKALADLEELEKVTRIEASKKCKHSKNQDSAFYNFRNSRILEIMNKIKSI